MGWKQAGQVEEGGGASGGTAHLALEFRVFLVNTSTGKHAQVIARESYARIINI